MFFENLEQTVGNGLMKLLTAKQKLPRSRFLPEVQGGNNSTSLKKSNQAICIVTVKK